MRQRLLLTVAVLTLAASDAFSQTWFSAYQDGIKEARKENWPAVVTKMDQAIAGNATEGRVRPYGNVFIEYHPYYYRGVAHLNLGEFEKALADLKKAKGVGEVQLGALDSLRDRAESKLAQAQTPTPPPTTTTVVTTTQPSVEQPPAVDPSVRRQAEQTLAEAQSRQNDARRAQADTFAAGDFNQGASRLADALSRRTTADSTADWRAVEAAADQAKRFFDSAISTAQTAIAQQRTAPDRAVDAAMAQTRSRVRDALAAYFDGNFDEAARRLSRLVNSDQKNNAMLWAFLGAARYYSWYLDGAENEASRKAAADAFRTARRLRRGLRLDETYFSPRVRRFYNDLQG